MLLLKTKTKVEHSHEVKVFSLIINLALAAAVASIASSDWRHHWTVSSRVIRQSLTSPLSPKVGGAYQQQHSHLLLEYLNMVIERELADASR